MYSTTSEDLSRDHLALQVTNCLKKILENNQNVTKLHKELVEINLSITAYVEESKSRLKTQRINLAHQAKSSKDVVEILSEKYMQKLVSLKDNRIQNMSNSPATPRKQSNLAKILHKQTNTIKAYKEDNNNANNKFTELQVARAFIAWYKRMIDHERQNFGLYLSDDVILEWFGRTIKTRKKVTSFLRFDMQCTRHDFTTIESIDKIQLRHERISRKEETVLASPLHSPELIRSKPTAKKRVLRSNCNSPEWAEGCQPEEFKSTDRKRLKSRHNESLHDDQHNSLKRPCPHDNHISSKGDGVIDRPKRKCLPITPPNHELGQGDCIPSTSSNNTASHEALNAQLPKLAVECNGYIEFTRTRNNRSSDSMKWERKCKVQVSYSEDPLNVGEYIIWALHYIDETKCRRNLLAAFEEVAKEEESKKIK